MLLLRTCNMDMTAYGGFKWPESGYIAAPDWSPNDCCGKGLHGLPWGEGRGALLLNMRCQSGTDRKWMVVAAPDEIVVPITADNGGKSKMPWCHVVYCGDREGALKYLAEHGAADKAYVFKTAIGGDGATLTGGDGATLTGGDGATLTGGDGATLTGGDGATLTGGDRATLTGGDGATLTGGYGATLTGGDGATLTGGYGATLTGGDRATLTGGKGATLTGGDGATLTGGDGATLTGGYGATLTGGDRATLVVKKWDGNRYRLHIAYVGENGIEANTKYRLGDSNVFTPVDAPKPEQACYKPCQLSGNNATLTVGDKILCSNVTLKCQWPSNAFASIFSPKI